MRALTCLTAALLGTAVISAQLGLRTASESLQRLGAVQ